MAKQNVYNRAHLSKFSMNKKTLFWGIIGLVVVGGLVYFSDRPSVDSESLEQTAQLGALVSEIDGAPASDAEESPAIVGTYASGMLPAASTPGRAFTLELTEEGVATFTADYQDGKGPVVEVGTWEEADGVLTTTLTTRRGYPISTGPLTMTYEVGEDDSLSLVDYDESRWGALGLTLRPVE